jgi:lipopolysaccharide export system ATP-binding protein
VRETLSVVHRAYLVYNGRLLREGTSEDLVSDGEVREKYLGENFRM